jgi:hypothetical protein
LRATRIVAAFSFVGGIWYLLGLLIVGGSALQEGQVYLFISFIVHAVLGIFSGIQLWRFKPSGRIAGILLCTYMIVFYLHELFFPTPRTSIPAVVTLGGIYLIVLLTLLIGSAKQSGSSMPHRVT